MSTMLLCRSRKVNNPYYVEDLGIHLFSGEELSYYIYHNALLIGDSFLEERLFRFIGQELGMEGLEMKLRRWSSRADLTELLLVILQDIHYYNGDELEEFRRNMENLTRLTAGQKMKLRGEYLLEHRRYGSAIMQYDQLLNSSSLELRDPKFLGKVYLACGVCYARQYEWQRAADYLYNSWRVQPSDHTAKMLYQITCHNSDVVVDDKTFREISEDTRLRWKQELQSAKDHAGQMGKGRQAAEWMDKDNIRRGAGLRQLTEEWKKEYRLNQGG